MRSVIIFRCFLIAALAALALAIGFSSASAGEPRAYPICAGAGVAGAAGSYSVNECVPYSGSTLCHSQRVQVGWVLTTRVSACHPW